MWTKSEERAFAELLLVAGETLNETVSPLRAEMYCRLLEDLPFAALRAAVETHLRRSKFFPKPAELRDLVLGTGEDKAEVAWQYVLREIRRIGWLGTPAWPDEATKRAALGLFGGTWRTLCENLPSGRDDTAPALLGFRKQFLASYGAAARSGDDLLLPSGRDSAREQLAGLKRELEARNLPAPGLEKVRG